MKFKQNFDQQTLVYNILLAGFAVLTVGWSIIHGPPPSANPPKIETASPDQVYSILGVDPSQISWYALREPAMEGSIAWERNGVGGWREAETDVAVNGEAAEYGAAVIASFPVQPLVQFGPEDNLAQYGLTETPQYVVSFGINAYNSNNGGALQSFTMYVGLLTPDRQAYYTVFVDELQGTRVGKWVYLIPSGYINALVNLMLEPDRSGTPEPARTLTAEPES